MSSGLNVYAVSIEKLKKILGSRDARWITAVQENADGFLASIDDIQDEAEGHTCGQAVAHLINGETSDDVPGHLYAFALEAICSQVGDEMDSVCPINRTSGFVEFTDAVLAEHGVPV